jgi:IMP dehydrogenase
LSEAIQVMKEFRIGGIPIIDDNGKLAGILTNRDMRFQTDMNRSVGDVMTKTNLITAEEGTDLQKAMEILQKHRIEKLPVIDKDGILKGLITYRDIQNVKNHPLACKDKFGRINGWSRRWNYFRYA